jgi:hypothetical protein
LGTKGEVMPYVWYVGYGSNLHEQRFLCYIKGGIPCFGKVPNAGCANKTLPVEKRPITISYPLYFALPGKNTRTSNWGAGGVAFVGPQEDKRVKTFCRMWKIAKGQYDEVKTQEGSRWYGKEMQLGEENGIPMYTITNDAVIDNIIPPSEAYIKTIALGLTETYGFTNEEIVGYLLDKTGIKGILQKDEMLRIVTSKGSGGRTFLKSET